MTSNRRTFAIISHPDAGKTTLTEKLLLQGGAIHLAGEVKARGQARRARSDWMKIEQQRGISVTSSVMTFEQRRHHLQPARHAGPRGLFGGYLSHADRGRFGDHGDRRGQGHRAADAQAVRGLPAALGADHHLRQQGRPRGPARRSSCSTRSPTRSRSTSARKSWPVGMGGTFEGVLDFASGAISRPEGPSKEFHGKRDAGAAPARRDVGEEVELAQARLSRVRSSRPTATAT